MALAQTMVYSQRKREAKHLRGHDAVDDQQRPVGPRSLYCVDYVRLNVKNICYEFMTGI